MSEIMSGKLVKLIENNADQLAKNWVADVSKHPATKKYHYRTDKELHGWAFDVYSHLGKWISQDTTKEIIAEHYTKLGSIRKEQEFKLSELIQALILVRRHLWVKVLADGLLDSAMDFYIAMELNNRVVLFFDRAIYYASVGYEKS